MREGRLIVKLLCPEPRKKYEKFFCESMQLFYVAFRLNYGNMIMTNLYLLKD